MRGPEPAARCRDRHGPGDEWPALLNKILVADIVVLSTPIWLGHMSSVAQRVLQRLDAELSHTDDAGRPRQLGKVAVVLRELTSGGGRQRGWCPQGRGQPV